MCEIFWTQPLIETVLAEVHRVLKPDGALCISYLPRKWALVEHAAKLLGHGYHERLWGDHEARRFLEKGRFAVKDFRRIVMAPQHPPEFSNRWQTLFNLIDSAATRLPLATFAHHLRIVAFKRS
ncbi:MAG: hypothetical protein EPN23_10435 [Verrucomicrobia bacterium]|nr:MAG: hypothetical protein EPN23_10435 [Verrucomicrobiota bacterium]